MAKSPYIGLPPHQVWRRAVSDLAADAIDPQLPGRFRVAKAASISSAGSCFAQRIAAELQAAGYHYLVTESGPPERNFGQYSARFGDVYTTLQLAQLAQRAVGVFAPREASWVKGGRYYDPFRPRVEAAGFGSEAELEADRIRHLAAVRRMLLESDVFIFTLGLTETWLSADDGAAFPLCPGSGIGTYDPNRYAFHNLSVDENVANVEAFLDIAWSLNPQLRVILTISPVPLVATMEPRHVIASTTYSKSVLRVAAELLRARHERIEYFASYEIVTGGFAGEINFGPDARSVSDAAVAKVMRSFFGAFGEAVAPVAVPVIDLSFGAVAHAAAEPRSAGDPCNEAYLASFIAKG